MIVATRVLLVVVIVVLAGWTSAMAIAKQHAATVSHTVLTYSLRAPVLVLALGVLLGHWFWPRYPGDAGDAVFRTFARYPVLWLPLGAFIGRALWRQIP